MKIIVMAVNEIAIMNEIISITINQNWITQINKK